MPSCPVARGAAISSAVRYWLLTAPLSSTWDRGSVSQCKLQSAVQGLLASDWKPQDQALCNAACKSAHSAWVQAQLDMLTAFQSTHLTPQEDTAICEPMCTGMASRNKGQKRAADRARREALRLHSDWGAPSAHGTAG